MGMGTEEPSSSGGRSAGRARGLAVKALVLLGGVLLLKWLRKSTTRWDHARAVADSLIGVKVLLFSREQARRDPASYFNMRTLTCPATDMVDDSRVLYFEQAFWRTPQKPFRQIFFNGQLSSYAIRDVEEYKNFCDRPKDQRPQPEEVIGIAGVLDWEDHVILGNSRPKFLVSFYALSWSGVQDITEHLTTVHLSRCERGKRCLYEGSTPPGGYPSSWVSPSLNSSLYCMPCFQLL
ncbi:hypothetical protein BHM03_00018696 [Ensete ventricosum]|nr:hypothetical protein BHM03_00018696 [Ensete ventricosum]